MVEAHELLLQRFGGLSGVRDLERIEHAIMAPRLTFGGEDLYPTIAEKAAAIAYLFGSGHGFIDGNKRIGWHLAAVFLQKNGHEVRASQDEIVGIMMRVAGDKGAEPIDRGAFAAWYRPRVHPRGNDKAGQP